MQQGLESLKDFQKFVSSKNLALLCTLQLMIYVTSMYMLECTFAQVFYKVHSNAKVRPDPGMIFTEIQIGIYWSSD